MICCITHKSSNGKISFKADCSLKYADAAAQTVGTNISAFTVSARAQARKILNINESSPVRLRKQLTPVATLKLPGDELKGQLSF